MRGSLTTYPLSAIGATTLGSSPPLRLHRFTWALEGGGVEQGTGNPTGSMFDYKGPSRRYPEKVTLLSGGRLVDLKVQCPSSELQNLVPRWSRAELQRGFPCSGFTESFLPLRIPACGESSGTETVSSKLRYHDRVCAQACGNCKPWTVPELFWTKTLQNKP